MTRVARDRHDRARITGVAMLDCITERIRNRASVNRSISKEAETLASRPRFRRNSRISRPAGWTRFPPEMKVPQLEDDVAVERNREHASARIVRKPPTYAVQIRWVRDDDGAGNGRLLSPIQLYSKAPRCEAASAGGASLYYFFHFTPQRYARA